MNRLRLARKELITEFSVQCSTNINIPVNLIRQMLQMDGSKWLVFEYSDKEVMAASLAGAQVIDARSFAQDLR